MVRVNCVYGSDVMLHNCVHKAVMCFCERTACSYSNPGRYLKTVEHAPSVMEDVLSPGPTSPSVLRAGGRTKMKLATQTVARRTDARDALSQDGHRHTMSLRYDIYPSMLFGYYIYICTCSNKCPRSVLP